MMITNIWYIIKKSIIYYLKKKNSKYQIGSSRGVVANMRDGNIVVSEFELQSRSYIHFRTNTLYPSPAMG